MVPSESRPPRDDGERPVAGCGRAAGSGPPAVTDGGATSAVPDDGVPDSAATGGVLAVVSAGNFAQLGARFMLSPVVPFVLVAFSTSKSDVGLALTGMWGIYALLQFPSGVLADRYGERALLLAGLGGTAVGAALVALAPSLPTFGVAVLLLGAGAGLYFSPASSLLSRLFASRGGSLGTLTGAGAFAGVVFPAVGGYVGARYGWRPAVALGVVVALPLVLAVARWVPAVPAAAPDRSLRSAVDPARVLGLLSRPGVAYTTVVAVCAGFSFQALSSFYPTFLVEYRGLDPALAGVAFGGLFGLSALAQTAAGRLSDRTSRDFAIALSFLVVVAGIAVSLSVPGPVGLVAGTGLLGVGVSWPGSVQARIMDQFAGAERGYGFGLVRSTYMLLAASGSVVVGTLADVGGWRLGYGAVLALLCGCLCLLAANRTLGLDL